METIPQGIVLLIIGAVLAFLLFFGWKRIEKDMAQPSNVVVMPVAA
jgi:hypothetical protein